jgi:hypothetical protein
MVLVPIDLLVVGVVVAEVELLHEPLLGQQVEHAVHAREADGPAGGAGGAVKLGRGDAAVPVGEQVEEDPPRRAAPVTLARERLLGAHGPALLRLDAPAARLAHAQMIAPLSY